MDVSRIIKDYLRNKGTTITHLASLLNESKQNLSTKLNRNKTLDTSFIYRISEKMEHDFFYDLSKELRKDHKQIKISLLEENKFIAKETVSKAEYDIIVKENLELHRELLNLYKEYHQSEKRTSIYKKV